MIQYLKCLLGFHTMVVVSRLELVRGSNKLNSNQIIICLHCGTKG